MVSAGDLSDVTVFIKEQIQAVFAQVRPTVNEGPTSLSTSPKETKRLMLDIDVQVYQIMISCILQSISICQTQRNTLAPVSDLPQDVVSMLFDNVLMPTSPKYYQHLNSLRLVCKTWMGLIDRSPHYWRYASCRIKDTFLDGVMERARGIPMVVMYNGLSKRRAAQPNAGPLHRLSDRGWPVRSFGCVANRCSEPEATLLQTFFGTPAPSLEALNVDTLIQEDRAYVVIDNLFGGVAPRLSSLTLRNVAIRWDMLALPCLRTLVLGSFQGPEEHHLTAQMILGVMRRCPTLESVTLKHPLSVRAEQAIVGSEKLVMEHLKELNLHSVPPPIADDILRNLALPACNNLHVTYGRTAVTPALISRVIERVMEMMPSGDISVRTRGTIWQEVRGAQWTVGVDCIPEHEPTREGYSALLKESIPGVARNAVLKYSMEGGSSLPDTLHIFLPTVHDAFPQLCQLSLTIGDGLHLGILSTPSVQGWLLPHLRTLVLNDTRLDAAQLTRVVQVVQSRRSSHIVSNREVAAAPLKTFRTALRRVPALRGEGKTAFEQLEEVFETLEYDPTPLDSVPDDPDIVFALPPTRRRRRTIRLSDSSDEEDVF